MRLTYTVSGPSPHYHYNLLQQIQSAIGILPASTRDLNGARITLDFDCDTLTPEQKTAVDTIMGRPDPEAPPECGEVVRIIDIWERRGEFAARLGISFTFYFNYTRLGGPIDVLEMHFARPLTLEEKRRLGALYAGLIRFGASAEERIGASTEEV